MGHIIGVDFGTTNSVVSYVTEAGEVTTKRFAVGARALDVYRTLLCFWHETQGGHAKLHHASGPFGIEAYIDDPGDARLIMSMKTYLAQHSFKETRIFSRSYTLEQIIKIFLHDLLGDDAKGAALVVAGRPVKFAGELADDEFGEDRLRASFAAAGMGNIKVALEPQAAGYRFLKTLSAPATVLVGDFGGGTSDFSVLKFTPGQPIETLGHGGIGIAGDHFDYRIIDHAICPLLGKHDHYTIMGKEMPIPREYYAGFARWHRLSLMKTPRVLRDIGEVARTASNPTALRDLIALIEDGVGYELYQAVSAVKAALSGAEQAVLKFSHRNFVVERVIERAEFEGWIVPDLARMGGVIDEVLASAGLMPDAIDKVFLTGGTSFVPAVRGLFTGRFGGEKVSSGGEFVSVAEGLALIGRDERERHLA
jgi:hypothetical chaperone protein